MRYHLIRMICSLYTVHSTWETVTVFSNQLDIICIKKSKRAIIKNTNQCIDLITTHGVTNHAEQMYSSRKQ